MTKRILPDFQNHSTFPFNELPKDLLYPIFSRITNFKDLQSLCYTNHFFHRVLSMDQRIWNMLLKKHFPHSFKKNQNSENFKEICQLQLHIKNNIKANKYSVQTLDKDSHFIRLELMNNRLIAATHSSFVIWELDSLNKLQTIYFTETIICCFTSNEKLLVSGSLGGKITVWDLTNAEVLHTIHTHTGYIYSLLLDGDRLFSGSANGTIDVWNLSTGSNIKTIGKETNRYIERLEIEKNTLTSVSSSFADKIPPLEIKKWDIANDKELYKHQICNKDLKIDKDFSQCYHIDENRIAIGTYQGCILIFDLASNQVIQTLNHQKNVGRVKLYGNYLFSCSNYNSDIKIWDIENKEALLTLKTSISKNCMDNRVKSLLWTEDGRLISAGTDGGVNIWDFRGPAFSLESVEAFRETSFETKGSSISG